MDFRRFLPKTSVLDKVQQLDKAALLKSVSLPDKAVVAEKIKAIQTITKLEKISIPDHKVVREQLRKTLLVLKNGLAQETQETKKMLQVYQRYTMGEASEQEVQEANRQFINVLKSLGLSIVVILPFSPITLPALVKLGDKLGIDILPDSFKNPDAVSDENDEEKGSTEAARSQLPDNIEK